MKYTDTQRYVVRGMLPAVLLAMSPAVAALEAGGSIGLEVIHTDNVRLVSSGEEDDQIVTARIGANIKEDAGPLTGNAVASLRYLDYLDNAFDEQTYFTLGGSARWEQVRNRLVWNISDYFNQRDIDNLSPGTPDNTEDVNVFSIGAGITLPLADKHTLELVPSFQDFYYETSDTDNQQAGIYAIWSYLLTPAMSLSLNGGYRDVDYDNSMLNTDFTSTSLSAGIDVTRARYTYFVSAGATRIDRDMLDNLDGYNAKFSLVYNLSGRSTLEYDVASDLTDTSSSFLSSSINPNTGSFTNVQTSGDVVRDIKARLTYSRNGTNINGRVWGELRDLDYKLVQEDRKVQEAGAVLDYRLTPRLTAQLDGRYIRTEVEDVPTRKDNTVSLAAGMNYSLSRKVSVTMRLEHNNRDSTLSGNDFDETRILAGVGYGFGR